MFRTYIVHCLLNPRSIDFANTLSRLYREYWSLYVTLTSQYARFSHVLVIKLINIIKRTVNIV